MRAFFAILAGSAVLVGCGSLGSSDGSSSAVADPAPTNTCQTIVTKTGVIEECN